MEKYRYHPDTLLGTPEALEASPNTQSFEVEKHSNQPDVLLRLPEVLKIIPVSKSHWWAGVKSGKYPTSIKLSKRVTCWRRSEVMALLERDEG